MFYINMGLKMGKRLMKCYVLYILLHGCEMWILGTKEGGRIKAFEMRIEEE